MGLIKKVHFVIIISETNLNSIDFKKKSVLKHPFVSNALNLTLTKIVLPIDS